MNLKSHTFKPHLHEKEKKKQCKDKEDGVITAED